MSPVVRIISVGPIKTIHVGEIAQKLAQKILRPVEHITHIDLPADAWENSRGQYRGETLLSHLINKHVHIKDDVLGIIEQDCYAKGLTFVFGQASLRTHTGFISLARLNESFYGRSGNHALYLGRILTECVHELGHMWGLGHCENPRCVMHSSKTLADTDFKQSQFCSHCREILYEPH